MDYYTGLLNAVERSVYLHGLINNQIYTLSHTTILSHIHYYTLSHKLWQPGPNP